MEHDTEQIKELYRSHGFFDVKITSVTPEIDAISNFVTLNFSIEEGLKYMFGTTTIQNNSLAKIDLDKLFDKTLIKEGDLAKTILMDVLSRNWRKSYIAWVIIL